MKHSKLMTPIPKPTSPKGKHVKKYGPISFGPIVIPYAVLVFLCFIFTQEYRESTSALLFWFLLLVPIFSFVYVICCRLAIRIELAANAQSVNRLSRLQYTIRIKNRFLLPVGHFEADLCFPKPEGTGVISLRLDSTLPPFGVCELSDTIDLPYHGRLLLAVEQLYIYDFFRLFRVRYRARKRATVEILPRDLTLETTLGVPNQDYSGLIEQPKRGFERNEQTDLRPYHAGDAVKDIHWKLSARSEEIIVKEFDRSSGQRFFVIADYSDRFVSPEDAEKPVFSKNIGRSAASQIAELSQSILKQALEFGYDCRTIFRSSADLRVEDIHVESEEVHHALFRRLSFQGEDPTPCDVTEMALSASELQSSVVCFVLPHVTEELIKQIQRFFALHTNQSFGRVLVYYADCSPGIADDGYRARFANYQMKLLCRLAHIMQVCCVRELPDGSKQYFHPADGFVREAVEPTA